ncbi:hypothetical protein C0995_016430 [Termitomyces sp. Mi166|nr:hypothetical protein C0995_016430 [Termitomyces sp. Mi166\
MAYHIVNNANDALAKLIDINNWITTIASIDNNICAQQCQFEDMLKTAKAEAVTANAGKKTTYKALTTLMPLTLSSNVNSTSGSLSTDVAGQHSHKYVYPLTKMECLLLLDHEGCTKCHKFYVIQDHNHDGCLQDKPPLLAMYVPLTQELAETTCKHFIANRGKPKNTGKGMLIATVMINAASDSLEGDGSDAGHADELPELEDDYAHAEEHLFKPLVANTAYANGVEVKWIKESQAMTHKVRKDVHFKLLTKFEHEKEQFDMEPHTSSDDTTKIFSLIQKPIGFLAELDRLAKLDKKLKSEFADCFPSDILHVKDLPSEVYHTIDIKPGTKFTIA